MNAAAIALLGLTIAGSAGAGPCGGDRPCPVGKQGQYRIEVPDGATSVVVWFHGYMGSAAATMDNRAMVGAATDRGLAFAAVDGLDNTWSHPGAPSTARDDVAFAGLVLDDLQARFGFGADAVILAGYSQGASMAYYAVCAMGGRAAGAVMMSGTFWEPIPESCTVAVPPLIHVHGTSDGTFPLTGRAIGRNHRQGDTHHGLALLADAAGCQEPAATDPIADGLHCQARAGCSRGALTLCLHPGGHSADPAFLSAGLAALGR
ncbi:PHB depolymerase family esterase [Paracoccus sp. PAMC 22219]|uniref:alpha/beta hydrolase family esterase n=1 Tax=Paracoccus sp. PAMC 22219 TaxID=1569209 RepID=UPI0006979005|nr:hypothetical protein [Paracoccus sp. PAMC 22219]